MSTAKNLTLGPTGFLEIQMGWSDLSLPRASGRKEGGESSTTGQLGKEQATSRSVASQEGNWSFLPSGIPADKQGWLETMDRHSLSLGKRKSGHMFGQVLTTEEASCSAARAWGHPGLPTSHSSEAQLPPSLQA